MTTTANSSDRDLEQIGKCALASIVEMVGALECDYDRLMELREDSQGCEEELAELEAACESNGAKMEDREQAAERIQEDPLSVQVRGDWHAPGEEDDGPAEYEILLSTGGPATRIIGDLDAHKQPTSARLQVQDWGTPWTEHITTGSDHDALLTYAGQFFYGE